MAVPSVQPRPAGTGDEMAILDLVSACDLADLGVVDICLDDVQDDLSRPTWQGWVVDDGPDRLRGYGWIEPEAGSDYVHADVYVRPDDASDDGLWLLSYLRERAAVAAPGLPVHVFAARNARRDRGWLEAAGGAVIRHYWRMAADLPAPSAPPPLPTGVTVHQLDDAAEALRTVHHVVETAFGDHYRHRAVPDYDGWLERQLGGTGADRSLWWLLRVHGTPAAALIGRAWPDGGYVQSLATLREFRGRGLARLLLQVAFAEFYRRGLRRVTLSVDAANPTGAVGLYESVGMAPIFELLRYELPPASIGPSPAGSTMSASKKV